MTRQLDLRKVIGGLVLTILWICCFLFIKSTLVIDWAGDGSNTTPFKPVVIAIVFLIIVFYHIFYQSGPATNKLSLTAALTAAWLALIIFYPFKDPSNQLSPSPGGAVAFFTLVGGLVVCLLWVYFFSDEIVTS